MKKICGVIGCGWLGQPLAKRLIEKGYEVHGTSRSMEKVNQLGLIGVKGHQLQQSDFYKLHPWLSKLDLLILNIPPSQFGKKYASAMANIAHQISDHCSLIFVSSTSVYPNVNGEVDESTPAVGTNRNGPIVRQAEKELMNICEERLTLLRMAGLVGGDRNPIKYLAGKTRSGGDIPVNLVHREDCIGIILKIIETAYWGQILNVCATHHPLRKTYYTKMASTYGLQAPSFIETEENNYKVVSNYRSRTDLKYSYKYEDPLHFPKE